MKHKLIEMNACSEAIEWIEDRTLEQAWNECERGDWMLWLAQKKGVDLRKLTLAKARCVKLVTHLMEDERSRNAVEVAERYGLGEATREELEAAYVAAYVAASAASAAYAASDAAAAAAYADDDAYTDDAYAAAAYTAYAAASDAYAADRAETLRKCADICRDVLTDEILKGETDE
jgi:hypothetical protein